MGRLLKTAAAALLLLAAAGPVLFFHCEGAGPALTVGETYEVRACKVVGGNRFEVYLDDGWIEARTAGVPLDGAAEAARDMLSDAVPPPPTVRVIRREKFWWLVDLELTLPGGRESMADALRRLGLSR